MEESRASKRYNFLLTRTVPFLGTVAVLYFVFVIYKLEVYQWLCENEANHAACYMVGTIKNERGNKYEAKRYFERSCELDYGLGCFSLAEVLEGERARPYYEKSCRLEYESACRALQKVSDPSKMDSPAKTE